jgi:hypothetical protein
MVIYALATGFTIWMAVEAVRRGDASRWLWIILVFPPIGGAVYFFSEYLASTAWNRFAFRVRKVTAADVQHAEVEVRRLDNAASWTEYASLLRARKDYARAADAAQRALDRDGSSVDARYELGLALLSAGRFPAAAEALGAVVTRNRSFDSDDALFALAKAQQGQGDLAGARGSLTELSERRGRPEILYDLAVVEAALGNRATAQRALQRIVDEAVLVPPYLQRNVKPWVRRARTALRRLG